jgi:hypothetical protein
MRPSLSEYLSRYLQKSLSYQSAVCDLGKSKRKYVNECEIAAIPRRLKVKVVLEMNRHVNLWNGPGSLDPGLA